MEVPALPSPHLPSFTYLSSLQNKPIIATFKLSLNHPNNIMASNPTNFSLRSLMSFAGGLWSQLPLMGHNPLPSETTISKAYTPFANAPSCPSDSPLSCHNSTIAPDSCCFIYPGGQLLQTQFWDADPAVGPADSWTLHGLWFVFYHLYLQDNMLRNAYQGPISATARTQHSASKPRNTRISRIYLKQLDRRIY
jgi:hypothetical protein